MHCLILTHFTFHLQDDSGGFSLGVIVGIAAGGGTALLVILTIIICWACCYYHKRHQQKAIPIPMVMSPTIQVRYVEVIITCAKFNHVHTNYTYLDIHKYILLISFCKHCKILHEFLHVWGDFCVVNQAMNYSCTNLKNLMILCTWLIFADRPGCICNFVSHISLYT